MQETRLRRDQAAISAAVKRILQKDETLLRSYGVHEDQSDEFHPHLSPQANGLSKETDDIPTLDKPHSLPIATRAALEERPLWTARDESPACAISPPRVSFESSRPRLTAPIFNRPQTLLAKSSNNQIAIDSLLMMRQNLEDQVTILNAKVNSVSNRHSLARTQLAAVCQSLQGVVQICSRRLPEDATPAILDYLTPVKDVDAQLSEVWGLLYYRGSADSGNAGIALARDLPPPPAQPAPQAYGPGRMRSAPMRDSQRQKVHATFMFGDFAETCANAVDWDKFVDDLMYGLCLFLKIAPSRVWAGDVRRLKNKIEVDVSLCESDDKSAKTSLAALRQLLAAPREALAACAYAISSLKPKTWTVEPTGLAAEFLAGGSATAKVEKIFFLLHALSPQPPISPWTGQTPTLCLVFFHSSGVQAATSLFTEAEGQVLVLDAVSLGRYRAELHSVWLTREGKEANREMLGGSDWIECDGGFSALKSFACGEYTVNVDVFVGSRA